MSVFSRVTLALVCVCCMPACGFCIDVEFIVGGYLEAEGGDWSPQASPLKNPFGIDFDSEGTMYAVELEGGRVHRIDADGSVVRIAGDGSKSYKGDGGPADMATFNGMHNCAITADDQLLIADSWNHCIRRIDLANGKIDTIIGTGEEGFSGDDGPARDAAFNFVMCIALNRNSSVLHIADLKNRRVRNANLAGGTVSTVAGNGARGVPLDGAHATQGPLVDPRAVASDGSGNLYILERSGNALRVVRPDGAIYTVAGSGSKGHQDGPAMQATFGSPKHICTDDKNNVYIADDLNGAVRKYDPETQLVETVLGNGVGDERVRLSHPHGVCTEDGKLFVVDSGNNRIMSIELP